MRFHGSRRRRSSSRSAAAPTIPDEFVTRMSTFLGDEVDAFLTALMQPPAGLRVNTLRLTPDRFRALAPFAVEPLSFPTEGFTVAGDVRPGSDPYHAAGLYYLQDPGAMVVGALPELPAAPRILDLAAAPGGKATHLAARMAGQGTLVANDVHPGRAQELAGNLERMGVRNAIVTCNTPARLARRWKGWFDLVLLDAPCSGESMFHKSATARREWSVDAIDGCGRRQDDLIIDAARLVRPGGLLVYSTCTFAPEENEQVIDGFLRGRKWWDAVDLPAIPGSTRGRQGWVDPFGVAGVSRTMRLWPHLFPGAGHYIAVLRRHPDAPPPPTGSVRDAPTPASGSVAPVRDFLRETLPGVEMDPDRIVAIGGRSSLEPEEVPPLEGVRVLRRGWELGSVQSGRFTPSHALAMGCQPGNSPMPVDLPRDSPMVARYLHGDTLPVDGPDGWLPVAVDGFTLGWGKRSRGIVKNHYPRGLRTYR